MTALWQRLERFQFSDDACRRLIKETHWSSHYARAVLEELRKLIYLRASSGDESLVGSVEIEEAWRAHLLYSSSYVTELCGGVLDTFIHHACDDGSVSPKVMSERFNRTLNLYRQTFGKPPQAMWSEPHWLGYSWGQVHIDDSSGLAAGADKANIPAQHHELWEKLKQFQFNSFGALYPFTLRLAEESFNCDLEYALRSIDEYRKFLFLARVTGHQVVPSLDVDEVWHLHLCSTKLYWRKMRKIVGREIHHRARQR